MQGDPVHLARLAQAEASVACLLLEARRDAADGEGDIPDTCVVEIGPDGLTVTYIRDGVPIGGEGL